MNVLEIRIPRESINDDYVTIVEWYLKNGERIQDKQVVVSVETSKAVFDIEAEKSGYLEILYTEEAEVPVGELIGIIHSKPFNKQKLSNSPLKKSDSYPDAKTISTPKESKFTGIENCTFSRKARELIEEYDINPEIFEGKGLIRSSHVIKFIEENKNTDSYEEKSFIFNNDDNQYSSSAMQTNESTDTLMADSILKSKQSKTAKDKGSEKSSEKSFHRGFLYDILTSAKDRRGNRKIPLVFVIIWYFFNSFFKTWFLGNLVRLMPRGINLWIHRLRGVKIGSGCYIDPTAMIEGAYPENVTIGDDVRIAARACIVSHIKAPYHLREIGAMPLVIKPVVLKDHCFIGINAVIMPGVTVGKGSIVTSGSVVLFNVPAYTMVSGNPAKVTKRFSEPKK